MEQPGLKGKPKQLEESEYFGRIRGGKAIKGFCRGYHFYQFYESGYIQQGYGIDESAATKWRGTYQDHEVTYHDSLEPNEFDRFDKVGNWIKRVQINPYNNDSGECFIFIRKIEYYL